MAICFPTRLPAQSGPSDDPPCVHCVDGWLVAETSSFWVCCYNHDLPAADIAKRCEKLHQQLCEKWFSTKEPAVWTPKCTVVLHPGPESYVLAVGREGASTAGCSTVERQRDRIAKRRIDLRGDRADYLTAALPHELTHIILADHFSPDSLPRWADEGMAILADTEAKRGRYSRELDAASIRGTAFPMTELLPLHDYPAAERWGAFYGESMSVVDYLVNRRSPAQFVQFLDSARAGSYDKALHDCYGIRDLQELDRLWNAARADSPTIRQTAAK
jgi:hypothetical protein